MRAILDYRPDRMMYHVYMRSEGDIAFFRKDGELLVQRMNPGDEMPVYLSLPLEEYRALADAIMAAESPRLAERALLADTLEREREVSDRLLTLVEQGWAG